MLRTTVQDAFTVGCSTIAVEASSNARSCCPSALWPRQEKKVSCQNYMAD